MVEKKENIWFFLKKEAKRRPTNINQLKEYVSEEWTKIDKTLLKKVVESLPRRCGAVIAVKGGHIDY